MPRKSNQDYPSDLDPGPDLPGWDTPRRRRSSGFRNFILFLMAGGALIIVTLIKEGAGLIKDVRDDEPKATATFTQTLQPSATMHLPAASFTATLLPAAAFTATAAFTPFPSPAATLTPPVEGAIALSITDPLDEAQIPCPNGRPCQFSMQGASSGVYQDNSLVIWTLVYPVEPVGQGWYLQRTAAPKSNGEWEQPVNFLGETGRVIDGSVFSLVAIAVTAEAAYDGVPLAELGGLALPDLRLIDGLVAQSDPLMVRVVVGTGAAP